MSRYFISSDQPDSKQERDFNSNKFDKKSIKKKNLKKFKFTENVNKNKSRIDMYPGSKPIPNHLIEKYKRGKYIDMSGIKTKSNRKILKKEENKKKFCIEQSAKTELLLPEESGFLQSDDEETCNISQSKIASAVDITSATKHFDLNLFFGSYKMDYSLEGRHLLLGGKRGHLAVIDWMTKKLFCEINVMESIHDVKWLHNPTMFATAQKDWVYIYDNKGIELHCIKKLYQVICMEFLRYHFLLATSSEKGFLSWLDISVGKMIAQYFTKHNRLNVLAQNPYNGVLLTGHPNGTVAMWSPNTNEPLATMLCHPHSVRAIAVNNDGRYMVTCASDRSMKIWDIRNLKNLQSYRLRSSANCIDFSQRNLIGVGMGNVVEVYKDCCTTSVEEPYLSHTINGTITDIKFCPYEDVLGVGHNIGFTSMLVPGSGEPNFDAFETNPFMTKKQRRETEVKSLLEKIQPEFITLNPEEVSRVDVKTLQNKLAEKEKIPYVKPQKIDIEPRKKTKGKSSSAKLIKRKNKILDQEKRRYVQRVLKEKESAGKKKGSEKKKAVLDRFRSKSSRPK
ncbi:WD repeat-containing protein 46 [Centruroides vittatus]|uniref:WD repeat-containing protein 46 n=1 Tax=Centruroides vittatus TaxID=120091 RepID=UPI0035104B5C